MWQTALEKFESNHFEYDSLIDSVKDFRFGLSIVAKLSPAVENEVMKMLADLRMEEPDQYYYPRADMHITILSIISCYDGFKLGHINVGDYSNIIRRSLADAHAFPVRFEGVTASPSCIMIQGYPDKEIEVIRNNLREEFKHSSLETSIDIRYQIHTAHTTVVRFKTALKEPSLFIKKIKKYRSHYFGTSKICQLEFVFNDWYQRHLNEHILAGFDLAD